MSDDPDLFSNLIQESALEIGDGYRAKNEELGGEGPVFLRAAYLQDSGFVLKDPERFISSDKAFCGDKVARLGDVVITTKGNSTGRVGQIRAPQEGAVYSPHLSYWRSKNPLRIDQNFLYYWSQSPQFRMQLGGMAASTDMAPYLSLRDQRRLRISLPGISLQRTIGSLLRALDDKIDLNRRTNETLEAVARAIFKDWFVDFGPVRAKAEGRPPPGLAADISALFPDALDHDDKPVGWAPTRIESVIELAYGKALTSPSRVPGPYPVYGSGGIVGYHADALIAGPSVIVGRKGTVGSLYWEDGPSFPIDTVFHVVPKQASLTFCFYLLRSLGLEEMNTDAAVPGLNRGNVYRLERVLPDSRLIMHFDSIVRPLRQRMSAATRESSTLVALRDLLLPKLMSAELRVCEAAESTEAALAKVS